MGRSPSGTRREITWQDEFEATGLVFELADDSDIGRSRVNEYLKPDDRTQTPRLLFSDTCQRAIFQMKRFVWDDYKRKEEKDLKQKPRDKNDDFPAMLRYLMNHLPQYRDLKSGGEVLRTRRRS